MSSDPPPAAPRLKLSRPIALVGLMGAGKTSIGRRLATALGLPFRDADAEVERSAGRSIAEIFAERGEAEFREGERRVIGRLLDDGPQVLATGGGAFVQPRTRALLREAAVVVWLKADLEVLARRVARKTHRPLVNGRDPLHVLEAQAQERYPSYAQAHLVIETKDAGHAATLRQVIDALADHVRADDVRADHVRTEA